MVRFLCFNGHVASHKPKKGAALSSDNLVPSTSPNQPKSLSSPYSMLSINHGNLGTNGITTAEKDSDDLMSKMGVEENRRVFQTGRLKKSQSLESGLEKKGKTHVDPEEGKTDGSFSDEIVVKSGLMTLEEDPISPPTEECAVVLPNKPSIFSIGDSQNYENRMHENCAADIPHSDNGKDSGNRTPHTSPLIVRPCSLPNIHSSLAVSFGFSRESQRGSRSSEDLLVLGLRHNETSNYDLKIHLRPGEGGGGAYNDLNLGFRNEDGDVYANANYRDPSRDRIVPDLNKVQLKSLQDVGLPLDDSPGKDFKIKRIQKWVIDLQPCSPSEDADELSQLKGETVKDHLRADEIEVRTDVKASAGMETAKRYISSLSASATACQLGNHGLEVVPFLSAFMSLKMLNLSGNNIARITAGALPRGLHVLNLSRNRISTIEGLRELTRLRMLDLSYNRIFRIGHGLASCSSLKELYLAGNKISEVEGLHRLLKLNVLDLRFNKISTAKCLGQLVANYNSLQAVSLEGNPAQKNVGDEQLKKNLQGLLPHLAYYNKQPVKVGTLKDSSDRSVRLGSGGGITYQFDRSLRSDAKSSRRGGHSVVSKPSSSSHVRKSQAAASSSKAKHGCLPPVGTRATTAHHQLQQYYFDFDNKMRNCGPDLVMRRSRSEGTLGVL